MKTVMKYFILVGLILIIAAACSLGDKDDKNNDGPTNFPTKLTISNQQVWAPNNNTGKLSQLFLKFTGSIADVIATVAVPLTDENGVLDLSEGYVQFVPIDIAGGSITNGSLSIEIPELDDDQLYSNGDDFLYYLFNNWWVDEDGDGIAETIEISDSDVKGNLLSITAKINIESVDYQYGLIQMGFYGTVNSLTGGDIYHFYVDRPCTITAKKIVDSIGYNSLDAFKIELKKGWNTVLRKDTYTDEGYYNMTLEVKNPLDYKWVLMPIPVSP